MKYLKKFNENIDYENELSEFCKNNLSFLLDNGYYFAVLKNPINYCIHIFNINKKFKWDDIKDELIPFLHLLSKNYLLSNNFGNDPICIHTGNISYNYFKLDDLLNDNIDSDNIDYIEIYTKDK